MHTTCQVCHKHPIMFYLKLISVMEKIILVYIVNIYFMSNKINTILSGPKYY